MKKGVLFVYVTASCRQEAEHISRTVVEEGLAACANIFGTIRSVYRWCGKMETGGECAFWLKTRASLWPALSARIRALHSYEVPCIVAWPVKHGYRPFLDWIYSETRMRARRRSLKGWKRTP